MILKSSCTMKLLSHLYKRGISSTILILEPIHINHTKTYSIAEWKSFSRSKLKCMYRRCARLCNWVSNRNLFHETPGVEPVRQLPQSRRRLNFFSRTSEALQILTLMLADYILSVQNYCLCIFREVSLFFIFSFIVSFVL